MAVALASFISFLLY